MAEPEKPDAARAAIARARLEIESMGAIVDALEPLDTDGRERCLAAAAIISGVVSMSVVRTVLKGI